MTASTQAAAFYPPRAKSAAMPLRFPQNIVKLLSNNLEIIPERAYDEPLVLAPGPPRMAFFTGPDMVKTLLLTRWDEFPKGRLQVEILEPIFGQAMLSAEGKEWRWQRSAAAPLFRHEELLHDLPAMNAAARGALEFWRAAPAGTVQPIHDDMMRAAFHVIGNSMLTGGAEEVLSSIEKGHADYYAGMNWWVVYRLLKLPHWLPRPGGKAMRAHETRLREAAIELVKARRANAAEGRDLLARMLRASDPETGRTLTDVNVAENIVSFLMAGYDTSALAVTWALYLVSQSPEWEERIRREVNAVVGTGPVKAEHLDSLVVVQQVLNETLRLYPTAPIILRDIPKDTEFDGITVPAGTIGLIPIYAIHRHRALWQDPDCFDPDRFSPDHGGKPSRFQFMPFGAGPRICIGAAFSMLEATVMLSTFIRDAHFDLAPGFTPKPSGQMFLLPKDGMPMYVTPRERLA